MVPTTKTEPITYDRKNFHTQHEMYGYRMCSWHLSHQVSNKESEIHIWNIQQIFLRAPSQMAHLLFYYFKKIEKVEC